MKKYFLVLLTIVSFSLRAADQQMTDEEMALQVPGQDMQTGADFKAAQAMQTEEDAKGAMALENDAADKKQIHYLKFDADDKKQDEIIKQAIEKGLHPDQCVIDFNPVELSWLIFDPHLPAGRIKKETVLNYAFRKKRRELAYYLWKKGATKINRGCYLTTDDLNTPRTLLFNQMNFQTYDVPCPNDIVIHYLYENVRSKTSLAKSDNLFGTNSFEIYPKLYLDNPDFILINFLLNKKRSDAIGIVAHQMDRSTLPIPEHLMQILASVYKQKTAKGIYESLKKFSKAVPLLIRLGHSPDISIEVIQRIQANLKQWPQQAKLIEEFDKALQEIEYAKKEVAETHNGIKSILADQEHLKIPQLATLAQDYLNDDVLYPSIVPQIEALKTELATGLAQCEAQYQEEKRLKQELERKKHIEECERFKRETGIDFDTNEQLSIGNFNPGELSFGAFQDDFDGFGLSSNSHNGMGNSSYTQYQPMLLNAGANGMSQSTSSHNGLSSSSHNGSQSSSSNSDWLRAHSAPQSSSSHNGLSNAAHNGMQGMRDASQSSSSSDAPHGKGEKRKSDDDDNRDGAKRSRTENGNSNNSNQNGNK